MAHAAPASRRRTARPRPSTDVFSPRAHRIASIAVPVVLGLVYGYWVAADRRSGGEITGWNLLLGFVSAVVFMLLFVAVRTVSRQMPREMHAIMWAAFTGCAVGFLYSQTGHSVVRSSLMGLAFAAACFIVLFYRYYTHEDAKGRPTS
ncbi:MULTISPECIES: hypothetical protein [Streptomyces]|jgi:hypothetical protein|uniref:hypothetical protein n=1 Tax=Streptomyces TaxID=1883 RepID=UPI000E1C739E|nr:hypothetical protein [Streptomyces sp. M7]RDS66768.1 hypothetical protein DWC19_01290 [Streptomyces sp. M7]